MDSLDALFIAVAVVWAITITICVLTMLWFKFTDYLEELNETKKKGGKK